MLSREYGNLAGAGGVKDVAEQLSCSLAAWSGRKVSVALPLYGFMDAAALGFVPLADPQLEGTELLFDVEMNYAYEERRESVRVWYGKKEGVHIYLLDSQRFREKASVYTYTIGEELADPSKRQGEGHFDYFAMNLLHQKAALQLMLLLDEKPDIIHCHDGHTAVLPAIIAETPWLCSYFRHTGCIVTIHNAGAGYHQDVPDLPYAKAMTGLPWHAVMRCRLSGGSFDPLMAAGVYATVNTVSENYARELQNSVEDEQTGWLGHHLLDMGTKLEGITNGVDPHAFSPRRGSEIGLAEAFDPLEDDTMAGKAACKKRLLEQLSAVAPEDGVSQYGFLDGGEKVPLFTFIGRLSAQKGVDILRTAIVEMVASHEEFQMVILGTGPAYIERELIVLTDQAPGKICFLSGYNPRLANTIYSAGDFFVIPSRYEPCGLTDYIAQLFANLPVVHHIGGLVKVIDGETGFAYQENSPGVLARTMERAMTAYADKALIRTMQKKAIETIEKKYTWKEVKKHYLELYKKAIIEQTAR